MPKVNAPESTPAYPSSQEGVWNFPWGTIFDKAILDPTILRFELQIDELQTFSSPALIDVFSNSANIVAYANGPLGKAISVMMPKRQAGLDQTWYWRLRINGSGGYAGDYISDWSQVQTLDIPSDVSLIKAQALFADIADAFSYSKAANSSNLYKIMGMIGRELDQLNLENEYSVRDLSIDDARDTGIANNFANLIQLQQVASEPNASYRWKTRELFRTFLNHPGVIIGIDEVVEAFVGEPPDILEVSSQLGWVLPFYFIKAPGHPEIKPIIVLYSLNNKGFNWTLTIWNSWNLTFDNKVLEDYVNRIKPAHTKVTFVYPTQRHFQFRFNQAVDWNAFTLVNLQTNQSGGLTLIPGQTSGTATSPVFHVANSSAWDIPELDQDLVGQTITVQMRTSPNGVGGFTAYFPLSLGIIPANPPIQDYIQFQITITTTNVNNRPVLNAMRFNMQHT